MQLQHTGAKNDLKREELWISEHNTCSLKRSSAQYYAVTLSCMTELTNTDKSDAAESTQTNAELSCRNVMQI